MKKIVNEWRKQVLLRNAYFQIIDNHKLNLAVRTIKAFQIIVNRKRASEYISSIYKEKLYN